MFIETDKGLINLAYLVGHEVDSDYSEEGHYTGTSLYVRMKGQDELVLLRAGFDGGRHAFIFLTMCIRRAHHFGICEEDDMKQIYTLSDHMKNASPDERNLAVLGLAPERRVGGAS